MDFLLTRRQTRGCVNIVSVLFCQRYVCVWRPFVEFVVVPFPSSTL